MDLNFLRYDLMTTASTARNCLRLLPLSKKPRQKVVIGDSTGSVQVFFMGKAQEVISSFKLFPCMAGQSTPKPISSIDLFEEKIFIASGEVIVGITKKAKPFYRLETNLSEPICNMIVRTPCIWTAGDYVLNMFEVDRETQFYLSPDKINHIAVANISNEKAFDCILACNDRMLRVVRNSELIPESGVEGNTSTVSNYVSRASPNKEILYGTQSGHIGSFKITPQGLQKAWMKFDAANTGGFTSIKSFDYLRDGTTQIIAGRDNGFFELFDFYVNVPEPRLLFQSQLGEMITGLDVGKVLNAMKDDIIVSTYSGKILAFADYQSEVQPVALTSVASQIPKLDPTLRKRNEKKLSVVQQELDRLKEKLEKRKVEYSQCVSEDHIAVAADYKVRDKFVLDASNACWILSIELDCPIETVILQCDVDIELIDVDSNAAILSRSKPEKDSGSALLASYRNAEPTNRMEMRVRNAEGQGGLLQAFVIPAMTPKTAQLLSYQIRPLALHHRLSEKPAGIDERQFNSLSLEGKFSLSDINSWVSQCLPDVPERTQGEEVAYTFQSTFQGTTLLAKYRDREATFRSDNISTLAIIKDYIIRQATSRKVQVKSQFDIKEETCASVLALLHPKLRYQLDLSDKVKLIEALKEIEMQEQEISFMSEQYKDILSSAKQMEKEFEQQPRRLEFLHSIVKNLYLDKFKFKGLNVSHKLPALQSLLDKYDLKEVQMFFSQN